MEKKIAFITPINCLEYSKQGDILYILSHMLKHKKYYDFVKKTKMYKIFDNSVHEEKEITNKQFITEAIKLKVNEIILQDVMDDYEKTLKLKNNQLKKYYSLLKKNKIKIMGVLQGKTLTQIYKLLTNYLQDKRIDVIGISFTTIIKKFTKNRYHNGMMNRFYLIEKINQYIKKNNYTPKPIHLLGNNSWIEILLLNQYTYLRSNDGKIASRLAFNNKKVKNTIIGKGEKKLDLTYQLNNKQQKKLQQNINFIKKIIK